MSRVMDHKRRLLHDSERRTSSKEQKRGSFALYVKAAVVVSWVDFFSGDQSGTVHVDCRFGNENAVEHLDHMGSDRTRGMATCRRILPVTREEVPYWHEF